MQFALWFCVFAVSQHIVCAQASNEADALAAIKLATNPTTKLSAAEDFVARFPHSNARLEIAELIAAEISRVRNGSVALALLERARAVLTTDQEWEILKPVALGAYASGNRPDEAFALASELLAKNPNDLWVLMRMTQLGTDEARKRNRKYAETALQYGLKAIALTEKENAQQAELGQLYQQTAILYVAAGNMQEAKSQLMKAATLAPHDPANYALLGRVINADYVLKPSKDVAVLDTIIEAYARAVGLARGRTEYQLLMQQVLPDLTTYYKQRHGSMKGLQQLINKFSRR